MSIQDKSEPSGDRELKAHLDGFFKVVQMVGNDGSCRYIGDILNQIAELRKENERLERTEDANLEQIAKLNHRIDDGKDNLAKKQDELVELSTRLQNANTNVAAAKNEAQRHQDSLRATEKEMQSLIQTSKKHEHEASLLAAKATQTDKELRTSKESEEKLKREKKLVEEQLGDKSKRLREINSWVLRMEKVRKEEMSAFNPHSFFVIANQAAASSTNKLDGLFAAAYKLSKDYFGGNLPDHICNDINSWEKLRSDARVFNKIPLPSSNSPQAKQMRIAAVLVVLGHYLAEQIFQPFYGLEGGELNDFLSDLAEEDPRRETFLRSALLATMSPEEQQENSQERRLHVLRTVFSILQLLLEDRQRESFRQSLQDLCVRCCEVWSEMQRLEGKIDWSLEVHGPEMWDFLELPHMVEDNSGTSSSKQLHQPNGRVSPPQRSSNTASQPRVSLEDINSIAGPVWPCFFLVRGGNIDLLRKGSALGEIHVKAAKGEAATGSHREQRKRTRTLSIQKKATGGDKADDSSLSQS